MIHLRVNPNELLNVWEEEIPPHELEELIIDVQCHDFEDDDED